MRDRGRLATRGLLAIGLWLGSIGGWPGAARADDRKGAAQELFDAAMALMDKKSYADACPKLEESYKLDEQIGTLYYLAECQEKTGLFASAWANYTDVADRARNLNKLKHAEEAQGRADALKSRLVKMIIVVPEDLKRVAGLAVTRNGVPVGAGQFGVPLPVDPIKHVIKVSATGKRAWETTVEATGEGNTMTVSIPELKDEPDIVVPGTPAPGGGGLSAQHGVAIAAGGVGLVGLGLGIGFGADTLGKTGAAKPLCNADLTQCTPEGVALHAQARTTATVSTATFIAGGVLVAGAAVLWITAPKIGGDATKKGEGRPALQVGLGPTGIAVRGGF